MPRKNAASFPGPLLGIGGVVLALYLLSRPGVIATLVGLLGVAALAFGASVVWTRLQNQAGADRVLRLAEAVVDQNLEALTRRRAQLVQPDAYGKLNFDRWNKEIDWFISDHIGARVAARDRLTVKSQRPHLVNLIVRRTFERMQQEPVFKAFSDDITPAEFELFCAEQLQRAGWNAQVTMRSRDQGVDVVAEKSGKRVVLQCKLYSGPVGNGAVQEIVAGRAHEQADFGAVVTNSRYTAPAEQLAATNHILLLHYRDLPQLEAVILQRAA
jgi:Restriction endonuclease